MRDRLIIIFLFSSELVTYFNPVVGATNVKLIFYSTLFILYISKYLLKLPPLRIQKNDLFFYSFIPYLIAYLLRLFVDLYLNDISHIIYTNKFTYIFLFINAIVLPFIFLRTLDYRKLKFDKLHKTITLILTVSVMFSIYRLFTEGIDAAQFVRGRIAANENLDPIAFGHLGLTLLLLATHNSINHKSSILNAFLVFIGLFSIALANSRGPVVALLIIFIVYSLLKQKTNIIVILLTALAFVVIFIEEINSILKSYGSTFIDRIIESLNVTDLGKLSQGRSKLFNLGIENILENPVFGGPFLSQEYLYKGEYYHNFIMESFVALGIFGGLLYLVFTGVTVFKAIKLLKNYSEYFFISTLFLQHMIYSMFSRSVVSLPLFWLSLFLVNYIYESNKK